MNYLGSRTVNDYILLGKALAATVSYAYAVCEKMSDNIATMEAESHVVFVWIYNRIITLQETEGSACSVDYFLDFENAELVQGSLSVAAVEVATFEIDLLERYES